MRQNPLFGSRYSACRNSAVSHYCVTQYMCISRYQSLFSLQLTTPVGKQELRYLSAHSNQGNSLTMSEFYWASPTNPQRTDNTTGSLSLFYSSSQMFWLPSIERQFFMGLLCFYMFWEQRTLLRTLQGWLWSISSWKTGIVSFFRAKNMHAYCAVSMIWIT